MYNYKDDEKFKKLLKYMDFSQEKNFIELENVLTGQYFRIYVNGDIGQVTPDRTKKKVIGKIQELETRDESDWHKAFDVIYNACHFNVLEWDLEKKLHIMVRLMFSGPDFEYAVQGLPNMLSAIENGRAKQKIIDLSLSEVIGYVLIRWNLINSKGELISRIAK